MNIIIKLRNKTSNHFYVVPGGKTPQLFYKKLASKINNWDSTQLILSDERLTNDKLLSNTKMVNDIFDKNNGPSVIEYNLSGSQSSIEKKLKSIKPNLAILGLGQDGHTASLFPGKPEVFINNENITIYSKKEGEEFSRISLTFNYLMKSERIIFLIDGEKKARVLHECLEGEYNPLKLPAQYILHNYKNHIHFICDTHAAKYLSK